MKTIDAPVFKFACPNCTQAIETVEKPDGTVQCPTCEMTFAPVLKAAPVKPIEQIPAHHDARKIDGDVETLNSWSIALFVLGVVAAVVTALLEADSGGSVEAAFGVFAVFFGLFLLARLFRRQAAMHADLCRILASLEKRE